MKRIFIALLLMAGFAGATVAAPLTPEEALERASQNGPQRLKSKSIKGANLVYTERTGAGDASLYVFNRPSGQGYMILSADDAAYPVLGYADHGSFELDEMPSQMAWWLGEYTRFMEYALKNGSVKVKELAPRSVGEAISPLIKTRWDQNKPFNRQCPVIGGVTCPTGCVATAMAQVMNYWQYPAKGSGIVRITLPPGATGDNMLNLAITPFDWDNMLDSYAGSYTDEEANAVAYLMKACGYASNMSYSTSGSGAISLTSAQALVKNFGYNPNIQYCSRRYYDASMWEQTIYNELKSGRPIMYGGQSTSVGHEFVCDGYNGEGYFHFNWGWGGMSDGYFLLDALNPDSVGTGGGAGGGYNYGQDIIIGVQPQTADMSMLFLQYGNLSLSGAGSNNITLNLDDDGSTGGWYNQNISPYNVEIGATFTPDGAATPSASAYLTTGGRKMSGEIAGLTLQGNGISYAGWNAPATCAFPMNLPDGRYKMTICSRPAGGSDSDWTPVLTSSNMDYNYGYVTKSGSTLSFTNMSPAQLTLVSAGFTTSLYYECAANLKIEVKNDTDKEITSGFYPYLFPVTDENSNEAVSPEMRGEGIVLTLKPGDTLTQEFSTVMELLSGASEPKSTTEYMLLIYDPIGGDLYPLETEVTMNVNFIKPAVRVDKLEMPGLSMVTEAVGGTQREVYIVRNKSAIPFSATITCTRGYFGYPLSVAVFAEGQGSSNVIANLGPVPMLGAQQTGTATGTLSFGDGEADTYYHAALYYFSNGYQQMSSGYTYFRIDTSAVNELSADDDFRVAYDDRSHELRASSAYGISEISVFDLSGRKVAYSGAAGENEAVVSLDNVAAGLVMVVVRDNSGKMKSIKVMR